MGTSQIAPAGNGIQWTAANVVTVIRVALIPVFVVLLLMPWAELIWEPGVAANVGPWVCAVVFALISLSDGLDGYLARSRNEVTVFGIFMDPIADKVLVISAAVALVEAGALPSWVPIIIIAREFAVSGLRMLVAKQGVVVAASIIGKFKTATTLIALTMFIVFRAPMFDALAPWPAIAAWGFMAVALALTVISMVDYFAKAWPLINAAPAQKDAAVEGHHPAAKRVIELAGERGVRLASAESCTGGLICAALTSVPGSSAVVEGCVVGYDPAAKESLLGVDHSTIAGQGVVSEATAGEMAKGALEALGAALSVSTTGVAGPGGGTAQCPVGTVCFGLASADGSCQTFCERFEGSREEVRAQAVDYALELLCGRLEGPDVKE